MSKAVAAMLALAAAATMTCSAPVLNAIALVASRAAASVWRFSGTSHDTYLINMQPLNP